MLNNNLIIITQPKGLHWYNNLLNYHRTLETSLWAYIFQSPFCEIKGRGVLFLGNNLPWVMRELEVCWIYELGKKSMVKVKSIWKDSKHNF